MTITKNDLLIRLENRHCEISYLEMERARLGCENEDLRAENCILRGEVELMREELARLRKPATIHTFQRRI